KMPKVRKSDVIWVEPKLVCEVEFAEWTHDGRLRAPSYQGLREDKAPEDVRREEPITDRITKGTRELKLSNLDKVFFPVEGITKGDLLEYYRAVAPVLLPHLRDRPFTMVRWPDGIEAGRFFQKDAPSHMPDWIPTHRALVSTRESPRRRKWVNFPVPVERRYTYDDTRQFAEIVAGAIARTNRGLATTEWTKSKRRGVLIDSNQNGEGKTIASVYSVRPRPGAPVSTPLRWSEVNEKLDPLSFTMPAVLERVRTHGDVFAGVLSTRQRLTEALRALGG